MSSSRSLPLRAPATFSAAYDFDVVSDLPPDRAAVRPEAKPTPEPEADPQGQESKLP